MNLRILGRIVSYIYSAPVSQTNGYNFMPFIVLVLCCKSSRKLCVIVCVAGTSATWAPHNFWTVLYAHMIGKHATNITVNDNARGSGESITFVVTGGDTNITHQPHRPTTAQQIARGNLCISLDGDCVHVRMF